LSQEDIKFGIEKGILKKHGIAGASYMNGKIKWGSRKELYELYKNHNPFLKLLNKQLIKAAHEDVLKKRQKEEEIYRKSVKS
jgi:hypothetical protein